MNAQTRARALAAYFYGWTPTGHTLAASVSALGTPPLQLLDEPETPNAYADIEGYAKALLATLIAQTNATPADVPVCANIEYPWRLPAGVSLNAAIANGYIAKTAAVIAGVLQAWRKACGDRAGGYGAYGLMRPDLWGWSENNGVLDANRIIAGICAKHLDWVDVDLYFRRDEKRRTEALKIDGFEWLFFLRQSYADVTAAALLYPNCKVRGWVSHEFADELAPQLVSAMTWSMCLTRLRPLLERRLLESVVHFAGWGKASPSDVDLICLHVFKDATARL